MAFNTAIAAVGAALVAAAGVQAEWNVVTNDIALAMGVAATDAGKIIMTGSVDNQGADIFKSTDGGATWELMPHDQQMLYMSCETNDGVEAIAGSLGFYGQVAVSSITHDGEVFEAINYKPLFSSAQSVESIGNQTYFIVGFWMDRWNSTPGDGVMASFDAGETVQFFPWNQTYPARYGAFPTASTWFISGGTWASSEARTMENLMRRRELNERFVITTEKPGKRFDWEYRGRQAPPTGVRDARTPGYEGIIGRTTDGGRTFELVYADSGRFYFNGIDCIDTQRCWAVAEGPEGGWILATADGGNTWTEQYFHATGGFFMVRMLNEQEGWAVGGIYKENTFDALFVHTTDGGATWTADPLIPNAVANYLEVVSSTTAYATAFLRVGGSSLLAYTGA